MARKNFEMETVIYLYEGDETAFVATCNPILKDALCKWELAGRGARVLDFDDSGCVSYNVPKSWIKIAPPRGMSGLKKAACGLI